MEIKNRVLRTALVNWKDIKVLQPSSLKQFTDKSLAALKNSMLQNSFLCTFQVWQDQGGTIWCLDGTHRLRVLEQLEHEGHTVPEKMAANFIACENRKEAAQLVLVYSSQYAKLTQEGLDAFLAHEQIQFNNDVFDLPDIDQAKYANIEFELSPEKKAFLEKGTSPFSRANPNMCPKCGSLHIGRVDADGEFIEEKAPDTDE